VGFLRNLLGFGQQGMAPAWTGLMGAGGQTPGFGDPTMPQQEPPMDWTGFQGATGAPVAAPQPPAAPRPRPIQAPNVAPMQPMAAPQQAPLAAVSGARPAITPPGLLERFGTTMESPGLQMALSMLGNSRNGGDWGAVGRDVREISANTQQQRLIEEQRRRQTTQDQREGTVFDRQRTVWGREDEQLQRWQAAMQAETDPQRRAQLEAIGPQGYGDFIARQQQMQFQHNEGELDRNASLRAASIRSANENSLGRYFQSMDAQTLGDLNQQSAQLQAVGLPQLRALRNTIVSAGAAGLNGRPIDYNTRITLGRYFNGSSADRQTLEVWNAQILGPALETLRGLGAMSEREMEAAINSFSNPNMTLGSALQLLDERITTAERRVATAQAAGAFFNEAQGLTGVRNQAGQDWPTYLQSTLSETPGSGTRPETSVPRGGYSDPPAAAIQELRRDTSAAARREFDQTFGPGAAARVLNSATERRRQAYGGNLR
jgi:hypothetical protein